MQSNAENLFNRLDNPEEYINRLVSYSLGILLKAGVSVKNILMAFIVSVYMMIGKETFLAQSRKIIYAFTTEDRAEHFIDFCHRTNRIFSGFLSGHRFCARCFRPLFLCQIIICLLPDW